MQMNFTKYNWTTKYDDGFKCSNCGYYNPGFGSVCAMCGE